jgi:hypothetical protein
MSIIKYEVLILWIIIILSLFVTYKSIFLPYNKNILVIEGYTKVKHKLPLITSIYSSNSKDKTIPKPFSRDCGSEHIVFISYLSPDETEKQTTKICDIFIKNKTSDFTKK